MDILNIKGHVNFLDLHKDGRITAYHQQILDQGIILDDENYERLLALQHAGKLFYIDSSLPAEFGANIMPRDWDSVWDEATQSWIVPAPIVPMSSNVELLSPVQGIPPCTKTQSLNKLYTMADVPHHIYNTLKDDEKKELDVYLLSLKKLCALKNLDNVEIPDMPEFLKQMKQLVQDAHAAYNVANVGGFEFRQLTGRQQGELTDYLEKLSSIIKGSVFLRELPTKPKFLK